jgi:hypothetical protein
MHFFFAAVHESVAGPSRHFAKTHISVAFGAKRTLSYPYLTEFMSTPSCGPAAANLRPGPSHHLKYDPPLSVSKIVFALTSEGNRTLGVMVEGPF